MTTSKITNLFAVLFFFSLFLSTKSTAQEKEKDSTKIEQVLNGLKFRNIGPALTSGRIADIAIHPKNENVWA